MSDGWIKLHRKIQDNQYWLSEPFTRAQAWVDMIMLANHASGFIRVRGVRLDLERGQLGWSTDRLAKRWQWSRGKVLRFLSELKTVQQIVQQKNNVTSVITIVNYKQYQGDGTTDSTTDGTTDGQQTVQQTVQQTDTNKNVKKVKKEKNTTVPKNFSSLTEPQQQFYNRMVAECPDWIKYNPDRLVERIPVWKQQKPDISLTSLIIPFFEWHEGKRNGKKRGILITAFDEWVRRANPTQQASEGLTFVTEEDFPK